jgi:hypothetical protein
MSRLIRSPSYPFIGLSEAVERARTLYAAARRSTVSADAAAESWGYSAKSSGGKQTIAALRAFGLLEGEGAVRLTDRAVHILLNDGPESGLEPGSTERDRLLRQAALAPPVYTRLWERYGPDLPSDKGLQTHLVLEMGFNENAVVDVIRGYKATLDFAKLRGPEKAPSSSSAPPPALVPQFLAPAPAPLPPSDLTLGFPLLNDNRVELRVLRKIDPAEADQIRVLFEIWLEKIVDGS